MSYAGPPWFFYLLPLVGYLVVGALISVLAYLVIRFAVRDGLRGHTRWLESFDRTPPNRPGNNDSPNPPPPE